MNRSLLRLLSGLALLATSLLPRSAHAQCPLQWQPGDPIPFAYGYVNATTVWDPDGAGPAPAVLVVGGTFSVGTMLDTAIATFDGTTWSPLGAPPLQFVTALAVWNGQLVAAGINFGWPTVATWNGSAWTEIGRTFGGRISALLVFQGDLYVGGSFNLLVTPTHSMSVSNIVRWNGTSWSEPGNGIPQDINAMAIFGSSLYAGGSYTPFLTTATVGDLAIWDGTTWTAGPAFDAPIHCLAVRAGSAAQTTFLFAGGSFTTVGTLALPHIARLTLSTGAWSSMPTLPGSSCGTLHVRNTGLNLFELHAGVRGTGVDPAWRLTGTSWTSLGAPPTSLPSSAQSFAFFQGRQVVGMSPTSPPPAGSLPMSPAVLVQDGGTLRALRGPGFDARIRSVVAVGDELVVAGDFRRYGDTPIEHVARGVPGAWQPLGSGIDPGGTPFASCALPNGDVVVGGSFATIGGATMNNIARWNGSAWSSLGTGITGEVRALLALPNGELIAGGSFPSAGGVLAVDIARWNGAAWTSVGSGMNGRVLALARTSNGDVVAAGEFTNAGGVTANRIARWNGTAWSPFGIGLSGAGNALAVLPDGHIVVGGAFQTAGGVFTPKVARWNGSSWIGQSLASTGWASDVNALLALPNGDYFAGGLESTFVAGGPASLARHSGGSSSLVWTPFDPSGPLVDALAMTRSGDVVVAGSFLGAGGAGSHSLAVLRPACPAAAAVYGNGCTGSGGANVLTPSSAPWTGGTFTATATGMPAVAFALVVTGFSPVSVPMSLVLPQGGAGCSMLVNPDLLDVALPAAGVVTTQLALPNTASLAGLTFHHQVVPLEVDLAANIVAITATNALTLTIGVL